jgi:hypothetical protein
MVEFFHRITGPDSNIKILGRNFLDEIEAVRFYDQQMSKVFANGINRVAET